MKLRDLILSRNCMVSTTMMTEATAFAPNPVVYDLSNAQQATTPTNYRPQQLPRLEPKLEITMPETTTISPLPTDLALTVNPHTNSQPIQPLSAAQIILSNSEDGPEVVDISMWTQSSPVSSTSQHKSSGERSNRVHSPSSHPGDSGYDERSQSVDSASNDIPFATGANLQVVPPDETIVIESSSTQQLGHAEQSIGQQQISFIEGSASMRTLPRAIYEQLRLFCQTHHTDYPEVIKAKWPQSTINHTQKGNRTWFETPQSGERLSTARYRYGKAGQIIVVKDDLSSRFNNGNPALVVRDNNSVTKNFVNGRHLLLYRWDVWDPFNELPHPLFCWKVVDDQTEAPLKPRTSLVSSESQRTGGLPAAPQTLKRSASVVDVKSTAKKQRSSLGDLNEFLSVIDPNVGARRDELTGEIVVKRSSDGKVVMLRCRYCDCDSFQTHQGLVIHLRRNHNIIGGRDNVADICGVPIDEATLKTFNKTAAEQARTASVPAGTAGTPLRTQPSRQKAQPTTKTVAATGEKLESEDHDIQFIFRKSPDDNSPRSRSLASVNSAEKLFVNALVAGVAKRDTLMLTVTVTNTPSFHIVKNDREDFELILERVQQSKYKNPEVVITVEDLAD